MLSTTVTLIRMMDTFFGNLYYNIGSPVTSKDVAYARLRVQQQDDITALQRAQQRRNVQPLPTLTIKAELEDEKTEQMDDQQIIQTTTNPADIDVAYISRAYEGKLCPYSKLIYSINLDTNEREGFLRTIPHFKRLFANTQLYLPRYIFRVVHSKSAGKVFVDENGNTHFWSQAYMQHECESGFQNFDMESITQQLRCHISGRISDGKNPFASHFISTTDSFERAINKAQRHFSKKDVENVLIYVIDTHSLQTLALVFLMALALRAWNVLELIPQWKNAYFMHGALTEWVFWDSIVASKVEAIDYGAFCKPPPSDNRIRPRCLENIIPTVVEAGRHKAGTAKGVSRSVLHAALYASRKQEMERQEFASNVRASRNGPLPVAPKSVKNDKRVMINDAALADVWRIVSALENRNLLFVWILSLMTETYLFESIVNGVVRRYPNIIEESLELVASHDTTDDEYQSILVYYMPGRGCVGRVDINGYQKLMLACVQKWHRSVHTNQGHKHFGVDGYVVIGEGRPMRNLVEASESGLKGCCKTENAQRCPPLTSQYTQILKSGQRLMPDETDEQHRLRLKRETGNLCFGPDEIRSPTSKRVRKDDKSHLPSRSAPST